jgi:hypothetical protein
MAKVVPPQLQGGIFHGLGFVDFGPSFRRPRFADRRIRGVTVTAFWHFRTDLSGDLAIRMWKFLYIEPRRRISSLICFVDCLLHRPGGRSARCRHGWVWVSLEKHGHSGRRLLLDTP